MYMFQHVSADSVKVWKSVICLYIVINSWLKQNFQDTIHYQFQTTNCYFNKNCDILISDIVLLVTLNIKLNSVDPDHTARCSG
jgi:hypothetical protein